MPAKIARSAHRPPFELPKVMVAVRTSPLSCWKAGKTRIFTPVRESSGESRLSLSATADAESAAYAMGLQVRILQRQPQS